MSTQRSQKRSDAFLQCAMVATTFHAKNQFISLSWLTEPNNVQYYYICIDQVGGISILQGFYIFQTYHASSPRPPGRTVPVPPAGRSAPHTAAAAFSHPYTHSQTTVSGGKDKYKVPSINTMSHFKRASFTKDLVMWSWIKSDDSPKTSYAKVNRITSIWHLLTKGCADNSERNYELAWCFTMPDGLTKSKMGFVESWFGLRLSSRSKSFNQVIIYFVVYLLNLTVCEHLRRFPNGTGYLTCWGLHIHQSLTHKAPWIFCFGKWRTSLSFLFFKLTMKMVDSKCHSQLLGCSDIEMFTFTS